MSHYDDALRNIRRFTTAYPEHQEPMTVITGNVNGIERERRGTLAELEVAQDRIAKLEAENAELRGSLEAANYQIGALQARNAELEALLAAATTPPDPTAGAEQVYPHSTGTPLAESLAVMAQGTLTPGGMSVLTLTLGPHGVLPFDARHAPLLRGRTLRIVGPPGTRIGPVTLSAAAGDCSDCTLDPWSVGVVGGIVVTDQPRFTLRPMRGAAFRSVNAEPVGGVPVGG
jgi:hypothetical protein